MSYRDTVAQLAAAQKPSRGAPPYSRWVNRRLGRWLAGLAFIAGRTPNQVTVASGACSLAAILLVISIQPVWWSGLAVGALLILGYALDAADGQLARLTGGGTVAGEWLDHVVDAGKICLLHSAVAISFYRFGDRPAWMLLIPLGYGAVASVFFFSFILVDKLRKTAGPRTTRKDVNAGGILQTIVAAPTDYGILCMVFLLLGWPAGFTVAYAVMFCAHSAVLFAAMVRWWRELNTMGRGLIFP